MLQFKFGPSGEDLYYFEKSFTNDIGYSALFVPSLYNGDYAVCDTRAKLNHGYTLFNCVLPC